MSQTNNNSCGNAGPSPGCNSSNGILGSTKNCGVALDDVRQAYIILLELPVSVIRAMMQSIENLLKRPGRILKTCEDIKFLMIILENTLLSQHKFAQESQRHHNIVERIFGLISNLSVELRHYLLSWFSGKRIELVNSFISYRLAIHCTTNQYSPDIYDSKGKINITSRLIYEPDWGINAAAQEAFFTFLYQKRTFKSALELKIRRDNIIQDSLNQISENVIDLKKSLRIVFIGEDGVDGGGLRKEWFLLLIRRLFDPQYGMFTWDEDSKYCWFNPASFENSDQYYLVGVIVGLAIYNSTILDVHFPLACYKKLFNERVGLEDLKVFKPALARGLEQLLTFEGDVESTFCRDFVVAYEAFGDVKRVPLIPGGFDIPVTNANRQQFVDLYVDFILNKSISKQFEPFKLGFEQVCGGHALSLFRPEEIELMVRGSAEPLEIDHLRSVTIYEGFSKDEEIIKNFWEIFKSMDSQIQRRLLTFVTGTDRIPATGCANLAFKISCIGGDCERFPIAHTCFNQLGLYRYESKEKLRAKLNRAIIDSEGFWLK
ncbi:24634_t:CDS:10 [Entrophospora sp. SA101]|nr:24634_t:CDS:10 [Entrophospora sp. SA101]